MNSREIEMLLDKFEKATQTGIELYQDTKNKIEALGDYAKQCDEKQINASESECDEIFKDFLDRFKKILVDFNQDQEKNKKYEELNEILDTVLSTFESPENSAQITEALLNRKEQLIKHCQDFFDEVMRAYNVCNMLQYDYNLGDRAKHYDTEEKVTASTVEPSPKISESNASKFFSTPSTAMTTSQDKKPEEPRSLTP